MPRTEANPPGGLMPWLREALRCPVTGDGLVEATNAAGEPVLVSHRGGMAYPVRNGIPILLAHEATAL